jgi:hypothetical protein
LKQRLYMLKSFRFIFLSIDLCVLAERRCTWTDVYKTWREVHTIRGHPEAIFLKYLF